MFANLPQILGQCAGRLRAGAAHRRSLRPDPRHPRTGGLRHRLPPDRPSRHRPLPRLLHRNQDTCPALSRIGRGPMPRAMRGFAVIWCPGSGWNCHRLVRWARTRPLPTNARAFSQARPPFEEAPGDPRDLLHLMSAGWTLSPAADLAAIPGFRLAVRAENLEACVYPLCAGDCSWAVRSLPRWPAAIYGGLDSRRRCLRRARVRRATPPLTCQVEHRASPLGNGTRDRDRDRDGITSATTKTKAHADTNPIGSTPPRPQACVAAPNSVRERPQRACGDRRSFFRSES